MEDQYWDCDHCEKRYCANDWEERTAIHADDINRLNKPKGDE